MNEQEPGQASHYNITLVRAGGALNTASDESVFFHNTVKPEFIGWDKRGFGAWAPLPGQAGWVIEVFAGDKYAAFSMIQDMILGASSFTGALVTSISTRTFQPAKDAAAKSAAVTQPVPAPA